MRFLKINEETTLSDISDVVGNRNVEYILASNNMEWSPDVGSQFYSLQQDAINSDEEVSWQRKYTILNTLTDSAEVFETASLLNESGWKVLSTLNTLPDTLRIPETIYVPGSTDIIGDDVVIGKTTYEQAMDGLSNPPHTIDPSIFNTYSTIKPSQILDTFSTSATTSNTFQYFKIPWGEVVLYSDMTGESVEFPVYPEDPSDSRVANYSNMPDLLYQYEPWYVYQSSGPRQNVYDFSYHRQMWTGDESDGMSNNLIRFCQAQCYPNYNGAAVNIPQVSLYVSGSCLIHGIVTDVSVAWDGPILNDGWYAHCKLSVTITEIAEQALTYDTVRGLPTIG